MIWFSVLIKLIYVNYCSIDVKVEVEGGDGDKEGWLWVGGRGGCEAYQLPYSRKTIGIVATGARY